MNPAFPNDATDPASEKILVRGVNWLGNAVMSIPALQRLRQAKPRARITLLTPEKLAGLWEGQSFLDDLLLFSRGTASGRRPAACARGNFPPPSPFPILSVPPWSFGWAAFRSGPATPVPATLFLTNPVPPREGARPMRKRSAGEIRQLLARAPSPPPPPASAHHIHDYLRLVSVLGASAEPLPPRIAISQEESEETAARLGLSAARADRPFLG